MIPVQRYQKGRRDCGLGCLAMFLPDEESIDAVYSIEDKVLAEGLSQQGLYNLFTKYLPEAVLLRQIDTELVEGRTYIITVPSLNLRGGGHFIVVKLITVDYWLVLDPTPLDKVRYTCRADISSWFEAMEVL